MTKANKQIHALKWPLAVFGVAAIATTAWLLWPAANVEQSTAAVEDTQGPETQPEVETDTFGQLPSDAASKGRKPGCQFAGADRLAYAVAIEQDGDFDPSALGLPGNAPVPTLRQSTSASLQMRVLTANDADGSAVLQARLTDVIGSTQAMQNGINEPFLLRLTDRCEIAGFARMRSTPRAHARAAQAIVSELQFHWPEESGEERPAQNGTGSYLARYAVADDPGGLLVQRTNASYDEFWDVSSVSESLQPIPDRSLSHIRVGAGPWFEHFSAWEVLTGDGAEASTSVKAGKIPADSVAFDGVSKDQGLYVWENLLPQNPQVRVSRPITERDLREQAKVAHLTLDQSVEQYEERMTSKGLTEAWQPLAVYLEARPEQTSPMMQLVASGQIADENAPGVYIAMGRARTSEARKVLTSVANAGNAPVIARTRAMFAMADRDDVGVTFAQDLAGMTVGAQMEETASVALGREALLALGMLAGVQQNPEITEVAVQAVRDHLSKGGDGHTLRPAFGALANIGDPEHWSIAKPYAESPDPKVRNAAAIVFRRWDLDKSDPIVAEWLGRETDPFVKRKLYRTIFKATTDQHRPAGFGVAGRAIVDLATMPDVIARKAIVRIIGSVAYELPGARAALMQQIPLELERKRGIYKIVAEQLKPEDVREAMGL